MNCKCEGYTRIESASPRSGRRHLAHGEAVGKRTHLNNFLGTSPARGDIRPRLKETVHMFLREEIPDVAPAGADGIFFVPPHGFAVG